MTYYIQKGIVLKYIPFEGLIRVGKLIKGFDGYYIKFNK